MSKREPVPACVDPLTLGEILPEVFAHYLPDWNSAEGLNTPQHEEAGALIWDSVRQQVLVAI